jgi:hypothetical protein
MQAGLTAVSQAMRSARRRLPAKLPNALAIRLPTIKVFEATETNEWHAMCWNYLNKT